MSTRKKQLSRKANLVVLSVCTPKTWYFAELEIEKIKLVSLVWLGKNINPFYKNRKEFQYLYKTCGIAD